MSRVEILQMGAYPQWDEVPLNDAFTMHRYFEMADTAGFLAQHGDKIRGIATRGELGASRELIDALPNLEIISVYGVGVDAVDLAAARARGIVVTNTPDVLTDDVGDMAIAMMLAQSRGVVAADKWVRDGSWAAQGAFPLQQRVHGRCAGVFGLGRIGHAIARRLEAFDMQIHYSSRAPKDVPGQWHYHETIGTLAAASDFLFIAAAATAETRHIVGRDVLAALGANGMLINVSRAANIDEPALLDALEAGTLGGAALDVFEGEPALDARFTKLPNVLLQPHHGSGTFQTRQAMGKLVRDNLSAYFSNGTVLTQVV